MKGREVELGDSCIYFLIHAWMRAVHTLSDIRSPAWRAPVLMRQKPFYSMHILMSIAVFCSNGPGASEHAVLFVGSDRNSLGPPVGEKVVEVGSLDDCERIHHRVPSCSQLLGAAKLQRSRRKKYRYCNVGYECDIRTDGGYAVLPRG